MAKPRWDGQENSQFLISLGLKTQFARRRVLNEGLLVLKLNQLRHLTHDFFCFGF